MGIIKSGILGGFKNKVGPVVGSSWKGISVMRGMPESVANPNTIKQQEQRTAFSVSSKLASQLLTSIVKPLWDADAKRMSGYNAFIKENIAKIKVDQPAFSKDIVVSKGRLNPTPIDPDVLFTDESIIVMWDNDELAMGHSMDDVAYLVVLSEDGEVIGVDSSERLRQQGSSQVFIPAPFHGITKAVAHLAFKSADGKTVSTSRSIVASKS